MQGSERGIQIPVSAVFNEDSERRSHDKLMEYLASPHLASIDVRQAIMGKRASEIGGILNRFEKKYRLFSEGYIVFPSDETAFPQESVTKAKELGLAQVEVPGFTAAPQLLALAKGKEINEDTFEILWNAVVPGVPAPISHSLSKIRPDTVGHVFLAKGLGIFGKPSLVESDAGTPYIVDFDTPHHILVEDFPLARPAARYWRGSLISESDAMIIDPYPGEESSLLSALHIPRGGFSHRQILEAITEHGAEVLEGLGLNPVEYRVHPIRYEDYLRVGTRQDWATSAFATLVDGWYQRDNGRYSMVAGQSFDAFYEESSVEGLYRGLSHFDVLYRYYDKKGHDFEEEYLKRREIIVRLAISQRHLFS